MIPEILKALLDMMTQYGVEKMAIIAFAVAIWPLVRLLKPWAETHINERKRLIDSSEEERKRLFGQAEKDKEDLKTLAGNHIAHLEAAVDRMAEATTVALRESAEQLRELSRLNIENTQALRETVRGMDSLRFSVEKLSENFHSETEHLRDIFRNQ